MARSIFYALGAFVGSVDGLSACGFWATDPTRTYDPTKLIHIDLAKNPAAAFAGSVPWNQVNADDHTTAGGLTQIGPRFHDPPGFGTFCAGVYMDEIFYGNLSSALRPAFPPISTYNNRSYEFMAAVYQSGAQQGTRYVGFHAKILQESGPTAQVQVWDGGTSLGGGAPRYTGWIDLSKLDTVDAYTTAGGLTGIGVGALPKEGALYIENGKRITYQLLVPKLPPGAHGG
jgi:hypothetical protein